MHLKSVLAMTGAVLGVVLALMVTPVGAQQSAPPPEPAKAPVVPVCAT